MADIRPFPGLRPRPDLVEKVASPPYDVLSRDEALELAKDNPLSFLHVVKAEVDLDPKVDPHSEEVYEQSARNLGKLKDDGILVRDARPCFYVYQLRMGEHTQRGLVVGASVAEYEAGTIKKHEHTRRAKEDDRARHVEVLKANAGPVLFTYRAQEEIRTLIGGICAERKPIYDFVADDGIGHTLWIVSHPEEVERLQQAFKAVEALYIADGHHRTASAFRVRNLMQAKNPGHTGEEAYNHFLAVLFPDDELRIMGYHRVVKDLGDLEPDAFLAAVGERFDVDLAEDGEPTGRRTFRMLIDDRWYQLTPHEGSFPPADPVESLDAAILQRNLLAPVLGIEDPRSDERIDFVGGIRGPGELERRCHEDMRVGFTLYPVSVAQLMAIADSGAVMPPKSTWFEPKLRSGIVTRTLD